MKQKLRRLMAGFLAVLTMFTTLLSNGTTAFAASPSANIAFWNASVKNVGEVSELKAGHSHGKILYAMLDGNAAYCMNYGLAADGGQLMNSFENPSTNMSAAQEKLLAYCLYFGYGCNSATAPTNDQCDQYIATQAMVWAIVGNLFGTGSDDSAARKLCNSAPNPDTSYGYYTTLKNNISASYYATRPSFASSTKSGATTYELKWNESNQRFEKTLTDDNGVLGNFDISLSGYSVERNGNKVTIHTTSVNTTATTATMKSTAGVVETTSSCVFWLTDKSGYQEFVSEKPSADPVSAYFKVKTENIGYGKLIKQDEESGVKLSGAKYGIYTDSSCTNKVDTITTGNDGSATSKALVAGTYYVKEIKAPTGYVLSDKVHTLTVKAGQTTTFTATDKEQLLGYMEGHDYVIGFAGGELYRGDLDEVPGEIAWDEYSVDDLIDAVCEWNYELILDMDAERQNPKDMVDFANKQSKYENLKDEEIILDKLFDQTKYRAGIDKLAEELANQFIANLNSKGMEASVSSLVTEIKQPAISGRVKYIVQSKDTKICFP